MMNDTDKALSVKETESVAGLSRVTIWRRVKEGTFPAPVELSGHRIGFIESEVMAWRAARPRRTYGAPKTDEAA